MDADMDADLDTEIDLGFVRHDQHTFTNDMLKIPLSDVAHDWLMDSLEAMRTWPHHAHVVLGCMRIARQLPGNSVISCRLLRHLCSIVWANCQEIRPHRQISACIKMKALKCEKRGIITFTDDGKKQASQLPLLEYLTATPIAKTEDEPSVKPKIEVFRNHVAFEYPGGLRFTIKKKIGVVYIVESIRHQWTPLHVDDLYNRFHGLGAQKMQPAKPDLDAIRSRRHRIDEESLKILEKLRSKRSEIVAEIDEMKRQNDPHSHGLYQKRDEVDAKISIYEDHMSQPEKCRHRPAVALRINDVLNEIKEYHEPLHIHLRRNIDRAISVMYGPQPRMEWDIIDETSTEKRSM